MSNDLVIKCNYDDCIFIQHRIRHEPWGNPANGPVSVGGTNTSLAATTADGSSYNTSFTYIIIDSSDNPSAIITLTLICSKEVDSIPSTVAGTIPGGNTPQPGEPGYNQDFEQQEQEDTQGDQGYDDQGQEQDQWC